MGETDLVAGFTRPLPLRILADILGVPQTEVPDLQELLHVVTGNAAPDSPALRAAQADLAGVWFRLAREHADDDSLLGMLARARQQREISLVEMTSLLTMLLVAGAHSMSMLLPRSVLFLSGAPQLAATLAGDDEAAQDAVVEELIRLCPPFPLASHRYTTHDVDLWGTPVPAGSLVLPALSAANRDPRVYSAPERACPGRHGTEPKHLSFGHGAHYCLGAVLARKQARIALVRLYQRFPRLSVAGVPAWRNHVVPEPTSLPVRLTPAIA
jgi:cytochrome P450